MNKEKILNVTVTLESYVGWDYHWDLTGTNWRWRRGLYSWQETERLSWTCTMGFLKLLCSYSC